VLQASINSTVRGNDQRDVKSPAAEFNLVYAATLQKDVHQCWVTKSLRSEHASKELRANRKEKVLGPGWQCRSGAGTNTQSEFKNLDKIQASADRRFQGTEQTR